MSRILSPEQSPDAGTLATEIRGYRRLNAIDNRAANFADWRLWNGDVEAAAELQEQAIQEERRRCVEICELCSRAGQSELAEGFIVAGTSVAVAQRLVEMNC